MKALRQPLEEPYLRQVLAYMNLVFGSSRASEQHWMSLKRDLEANYPLALSETEAQDDSPLKPKDPAALLAVFSRVTEMLGLRWRAGVARTETLSEETPFDDTDLEGVGERVKARLLLPLAPSDPRQHMNIVAHAQGYFWHLKGLAIRTADPGQASHFYEVACERFEVRPSLSPLLSAHAVRRRR